MAPLRAVTTPVAWWTGDGTCYSPLQTANFIAGKRLADLLKIGNQMHGNTEGIFKIKMELISHRMDARTTRCGSPKSTKGLPKTTQQSQTATFGAHFGYANDIENSE